MAKKQVEIGLMIREMREGGGLSQDDLANKLGTKRSAISRWENRAEDIKVSTLGSIAEACGYLMEIQVAKKPSKTVKKAKKKK